MTSSLPTRAVLALTLVLSASAAPDAVARFNLESGSPAQSQSANPRPEVHSSPNQRATGIPAIMPAPAPALRAGIRHDEQLKAEGFAYTVPTDARYSSAGTNGYVRATPLSVPAVQAVDHNGGFDWGDAGIGAAGGVMLVMVGAGAAFAVSQQRTRRARGSTSAAN